MCDYYLFEIRSRKVNSFFTKKAASLQVQIPVEIYVEFGVFEIKLFSQLDLLVIKFFVCDYYLFKILVLKSLTVNSFFTKKAASFQVQIPVALCVEFRVFKI